MEIVEHKEIGDGAWDAFCDASPEAWLRHSSIGRRIALALDAGNTDNSCGVMREGVLVAVSPLITQPLLESGGLEFAFSINTRPTDTHGLATPAPALIDTLRDPERQVLHALCMDEIDKRARRLGVARARMFVDSLAEVPVPVNNPLLMFGYADASTTTSVIELQKDEASLLKNMSKGHRLDVAFAERQNYKVAVSDDENAWKDFLSLHPRMQKRQGLLALMYVEDRCVAGALAVTYKRGAYYGMSAMNEAPRGAGQLIQWRIMQELKRRGFQKYDMGWQTGSSEKEAAIASFKRHFGGTPTPLWYGIKNY